MKKRLARDMAGSAVSAAASPKSDSGVALKYIYFASSAGSR